MDPELPQAHQQKNARLAEAMARSSCPVASSPSNKPAQPVRAQAKPSKNPANPAVARAGKKKNPASICASPPGVDTGTRLRSTGNGESGLRGGPSGDLYVVLHIKEHEIFERELDNIICEVPINFAIATLGGEVEVPTLQGKASIKIPAGTQSGTTFRLRGRGIKSIKGNSTGDLLIRVNVEVPTKLNQKQKAKLEEFAELCGEDVNPIAKSFLERAKEFFK